jgi:hypothetical protein
VQLPVITAGYTAILALLYALLGLQVVRLPFYIFRVGGMVITNLVMITCAVMILSRLLRGA